MGITLASAPTMGPVQFPVDLVSIAFQISVATAFILLFGGGIVIVPVLSYILPLLGIDPAIQQKLAVSTSLAWLSRRPPAPKVRFAFH